MSGDIETTDTGEPETGELVAVVTVEPDGSLEFLATEATADLQRSGPCKLERASHVVPLCPVRWLAFVALRWAFGDRGWVADWTRAWRCLWIADLSPSSGPVLGPFANRNDAIRAEVAWILDHA